jgi:hypothetical protein
VLDEVFEMGLGPHLGAPHDRPVPGEVGAGPHGVDAGEAADVARQDPVEGEHEARRRHDRAVGRAGGVIGVAPQRVVVPDAVSVVTDVVSCCLVAPGLDGVGDGDADEPADAVEGVVGDDGEAGTAVGVDVDLIVGGHPRRM